MSGDARKEIELMIEACVKQGWRVHKGRKHWRLYPVDPTMPPATLSVSPNGAAIRNARADLRKRGAILP